MPADDLLAERLLRVIDEGRRTATYKLALLLGLMDIVAAEPGVETVPTRTIAANVLERYYLQVGPYVTGDGSQVTLRQITMKGSPPVRAAGELRAEAIAARCRTTAEARRRLPDAYSAALDEVEDTFVRYPIPLLQVIGSELVPFLYEADWPEGTSVRTLRREGRDRVRLLPGVADELVVLGPLLRPLIELHWTRDVARWSGVGVEDERLRAHLFGKSRAAVPRAVRGGLAELQDGECFYCRDRLGKKRDVDHFLAWSRWPNDAIENLVLADRCNTAKSDHLAANVHFQRWANHVTVHGMALQELAEANRWISDPARSTGLLVNTYGHLVSGVPLWLHGDRFELADGPLVVPELAREDLG